MSILYRDNVFKIVNELYKSNTYIVKYQDNLSFIIDPGFNFEEMDLILIKNNLLPTHVFCTHGHFDHIGGVAHLAENYNLISVLHKADIQIVKSANFLMMAYGLKERITPPHFDNLILGGEKFKLGVFAVVFEHVPGHSKGSCFIFFKNMLFSGDSLYSNGIGSESPSEDKNVLRESLLVWWNKISKDTIVYPGHGQEKFFGLIQSENKELLRFLKLKED